MTVIQVPRPPLSASNPDREAGCLLKAHVAHVQAAEKKLPLRDRMQITMYANAVKTEREAAEYIRQVTEAIQRAHDEATMKRAQGALRRKTTLEIAAAAEEPQKARSKKGSAKKKSPASKQATKKSAAKKSAAKKSPAKKSTAKKKTSKGRR